MITNQKIDVGDVQYSRLSETLRFTVATNMDVIRTVEDIAGRHNMSMEDIAKELGKMLEHAIIMNYTRGGIRRKFD